MGLNGDILDFSEIHRVGIVSEENRFADNQYPAIGDYHKVKIKIDHL